MRYFRPSLNVEALLVTEPLNETLNNLLCILPASYSAKIMFSKHEQSNYIRVYRSVGGATYSFAAFPDNQSWLVKEGETLRKWPASLFLDTHTPSE